MSGVQRFRADIQGLRALAIVPVVLYHSHRDWVPGGYIGVDIFFVISGYLITRIILKEIANDRYSILAFYERRARRLFPALFALLAATLVAGAALLPPPQLEALGTAALSALFFLANIHYLQTADYFAEAAEYLPLIHTWSLAVEEQFYIAFPLLIFLLRRKPRMLLVVTVAAAVLSLAACVWIMERSSTAAFYLPFTRAYELLIGAALAIGVGRFAAPAALRNSLSLVSLAILVLCLALFDESTPFPGFSALLPCLATAGLLLAGQDGESVGGRLISSPPFVFFGNISYSLYLWHWPVLVFGRYLTLGPLDGLEPSLAVAIAVLLAWISWRFIERPVLQAKIDTGAIFRYAGLGATALGAGAAVMIFSGGFPGRFPPQALVAQNAAKAGFSPRRVECHHHYTRPFQYRETCVIGADGAAPNMAVWGDSFGVELAFGLGRLAGSKGKSVRQITASACAPGLDENSPNDEKCTAFNAAALRGIVADSGIDTVFIVGHYLHYDMNARAYAAALGEIAASLRRAGKQTVLVYPVPPPAFDVPSGLALSVRRSVGGKALAGDARSARAAAADWSRAFDDIVRRHGMRAIIPYSALCGVESCSAIDDRGRALYFDDRHLSVRGIEVVLAANGPALGL